MAHEQQMLEVAADQDLGAPGRGGGEDAVVIRIAADGLDLLGDLRDIGCELLEQR